MSSLLIIVVFCALLPHTPAQTVITLAGGSSPGTTSGSTDGFGSAALFNAPRGVAVDTSGAVYVADFGNHKIRLIRPNRTVVTFAGSTLGSSDGVGSAALFNCPTGVAVDSSGTVFVADSENHKIRLIHPNRTVITLAGGATSGSADGVGSAALFWSPFGVAVDASGAVYVADNRNHKIRLIYLNRTVVTLAGSTLGSADGVGSAALFNFPLGIALGTSGAVYVADYDNHRIRLIYPNRTVVTLAGSAIGFANGIGPAALFNGPIGVAVDISGAVYVADIINHKVRLIYPNRSVISLAGSTLGSNNGIGTAALFNIPYGVALDAYGSVIVADRDNHKIRFIYPFSCSPGTFANFTERKCIVCPPGSFSSASSAESCSLCPGGTFAKPYGSSSCAVCPEGHACPPGTSSWARLNCGRGNYCPEGSSGPIPCPIQTVPVPYASWASHPMTAQGPAFFVETSVCLNHCFWNFTTGSGDGMLSKC